MATLQEYLDHLDERRLIWPKPPEIVPVKAKAHFKPLKGIRAVTWSLYGTLLRISEGELLFDTPVGLQMQVALEKTIQEFGVWNSMSRKPGPPWEQLYRQYAKLLDEHRLAGTKHKGEVPEVNSPKIWRKLIERLQQKEFDYDEDFYGDLDEFAEKVACFFHAGLQGIEPSENALHALRTVAEAGLRQTLLADAQPFSMTQLVRGLRRQGTLPPLDDLFAADCLTLSWREGVRKPSASLYRTCLKRFQEWGIAPEEILHVGTRIRDDLAAAKREGMKTALYAADKNAVQATKDDLGDPELRPDRLLTNLAQIGDILRGS